MLNLSISFAILHTFVTATCYQAVPEQCDADPYVTAFNYRIDPKDPLSHRYVAISRDLEAFYSPGDSIYIVGAGEYDGMWMIADRMNRRWSNKIDLLVNNDSYVDRFTDVRIIKHVRK